MSDVTRILSQINLGDSQAAEKLLPLVYDELRKLATAKLALEKPGQTLQATALVHEAYIRLVDHKQAQRWDNRGHFFIAAAEAMRRIVVETARHKGRLKRGGDHCRLELDELEIPIPRKADEVLAIDAALEKLTTVEPLATQLIKLRYFSGFTNKEAADILGISPRKATELWAFARAWLLVETKKSLAGD